MTIRGKMQLVTGVVAAILAIAACGGSDDGGNDGGDSNVSISISGSSTVEPISARNAEKFAAANPAVAISVEGPGTGDGFKKFCAGEIDISDASRAIKEAEIEDCEENGVSYTEYEVAIDGLSVLTSPANTAVSCLNFADMYALVGPESIGFDTWAAASDLGVELGGNAPYPDAPLTVTAPGEESGTYDTFVELVLEDIAEERGEDAVARPDYVASPNDNVIVEGISGSDTSFGWVGYAFYIENTDVLKAIEIDGGDGCVAPTADTIASGDYPLSRSLFIYVNDAKFAEKPDLQAFVEFYFSDEGLASIDETGYVRLTDYTTQRNNAAG